ncbi:MAG: hypothetical protein KKE23_01720 [Nanoarchaeota archaeon]|nr:hypothetical protein [Nanoarchaeota archaeon]
MENKIKFLIFDYDGTLIERDNSKILNETFHDLAIRDKFIEYMLKKYVLSPEEAVSIGNSLSFDIEPAKKLGIKSIWISNAHFNKVLNSAEKLNETIISEL